MSGRGNKKTLAVIGLAILVVVATALVIAINWGTHSDQSLSDSSFDESIPTISIWHQFGPETGEQAYLEELASQLHQANQSYQLDVRYYSSSEIRDQLLAAKNSGALPDVVFVDPEGLPELVRLNILVALDSTFEDYAEVSGQLLDGAVETGRRGEHIYGLPFSASTQMLIYNPQLFANANQKPPSSMAELGSAIEAIHALGIDIYGLGLTSFDATNLAPFLWSNGGELTNVGQTEAIGFLNSPANANTVEAVAGLYSGGAIYDQQAQGGNLIEQFGTGKVGMVMADAAFIKRLSEQYPDFTYETMPVPAGAGGSRVILDSTLVAAASTEDAALAWDFIKTLTGEAAQKEFASRGIMPANKTALESDIAKNAVFAPIIPSLDTAKALPNASEWKDMDNEFTLAMSQVTGGYKDAQKALDNLANTWDALLP